MHCRRLFLQSLWVWSLFQAQQARAPSLTRHSRQAALTRPLVNQRSRRRSARRRNLRQMPPPEVAAKVFARYGIAKRKRSAYVIDQLIPARLGGSTTVENLWPEKRGDAASKDAVETSLHEMVCSGQVELAAAQQAIVSDWSTAQAAMEQAAAARKQAVAQFVAAAQAVEKQRQLDEFLASLPPPTTTRPPQAPPSNCPNGTYVNTAGNTVCQSVPKPGRSPSRSYCAVSRWHVQLLAESVWYMLESWRRGPVAVERTAACERAS